MDRERRMEYLVLTLVPLPRPTHQYISLCAFCQLCTWISSVGDCGEGIPVCQAEPGQMLGVIGGNGADCILFAPLWVREDCVDAIGMKLRGEYPNPSTMRKASG